MSAQFTYLSKGEADEFPTSSNASVIASNDTEHERADKETLDLDPLASKHFDQSDGEEVAGYVASGGNDEITVAALQESVVFSRAGGKADVGQKDGLIQIGAVECNIDKEPCRGRADEGLEMSPFREVDEECLEFFVRFWLPQVGLHNAGMSFRAALNLLLACMRILV